VTELKALIPYLRRYRTGILWGLALVVASNAFGLAVPWLVKQAIDALEEPGVTAAVPLRYAGWIVLMAVLGGIARYGMRELLNGISRKVEYDLRNDFFVHLLRLDRSFYGRTSTGDIMSRATNDIAAVRMAAGPAYMYLVDTAVVALITLPLLFWIDPRLALLSLVPMVLLPPATLRFCNTIHTRFEQIQEQFGRLSTTVQENLAGVRIVKAYSQEDAQIERFREHASDYLEKNLRLAHISGLFYPLLNLLAGLGLVIVLWVGGLGVMRGTMTVGDFVAFGLYLGRMTWPLIALGWVVNLFQRGSASMGRLNRIFEQQPSAAEAAHPVVLEQVHGELEFREVGFRYPGTERWVLRGLSFRVPAGSTLAVVGATGSGKSTLVSLLARLYDPTEGEVLLDGVPLRELSLAQLRAVVGLVPQDAFLFSDTIRDNLALGFDEPDGEARERRIRGAAAIAQLDETVTGFAAGYDTRLGERGINLSGGQKQRATLARAIARDPRVLVLDDALSAVDTHTEFQILHGLRDVLRGRTSVIVSHRVSAVMEADHIIVLDDGRIAEQGTHERLLELGGLYATLQRRQLLTEDLATGGALARTERAL
jgi:ATP-binding cassette, subfamily B, multidrug efflux pump